MNDLIRLAAERAARAFDHASPDGVFNAAGFSTELTRLAGVNGALDGKVVRAMLTGRPDVRPLHGGAHYQLRTRGAP